MLEKRFEEQMSEGLKDLPPIHHSHDPFTTSQEDIAKILSAAEQYPGWGCTKISDYLKLEGCSVSSPVVQKILIRNGLASQFDRYLHLEEKHLKEGIPLTEEQIRKIEKFNPCFAERHVESSLPASCYARTPSLLEHYRVFTCMLW